MKEIDELLAYCIAKGADIDFANWTKDQVNKQFADTIAEVKPKLLQSAKNQVLTELRNSIGNLYAEDASDFAAQVTQLIDNKLGGSQNG